MAARNNQDGPPGLNPHAAVFHPNGNLTSPVANSPPGLNPHAAVFHPTGTLTSPVANSPPGLNPHAAVSHPTGNLTSPVANSPPELESLSIASQPDDDVTSPTMNNPPGSESHSTTSTPENHITSTLVNGPPGHISDPTASHDTEHVPSLLPNIHIWNSMVTSMGSSDRILSLADSSSSESTLNGHGDNDPNLRDPEKCREMKFDSLFGPRLNYLLQSSEAIDPRNLFQGSYTWPTSEGKAIAAVLYRIGPVPPHLDAGSDIGGQKNPGPYVHIRSKAENDTWAKHVQENSQPTPARIDWPVGKLPLEIYENIAEFLSIDDLKFTRLVCKEMDRNFGRKLFDTVVVPFGEDIYGLILDKASLDRLPILTAHLQTYKSQDITTFKSLGPRVVNFGMTFDFDESTLFRVPDTTVRTPESTTAESSTLASMLSCLTGVIHLALSLDTGLGWLSGVDKSIHTHIFTRPPQLFDSSSSGDDWQKTAQILLWKYFMSRHGGSEESLREAGLRSIDVIMSEKQYRNLVDKLTDACCTTGSCGITSDLDSNLLLKTSDQLWGQPHRSGQHWSDPHFFKAGGYDPNATVEDACHGMLYSFLPAASSFMPPNTTFNARTLTSHQKQYLMEIGWAQRTFLSAYITAGINDSAAFANVRSLSFTRVSSNFLVYLANPKFLDSMHNLHNLVIKVVPEYRDLVDDDGGDIAELEVAPSRAVGRLYNFLRDFIAYRTNIKALTVGFVGGGEQETGIYGRNRNILAAPIVHPCNMLTTLDLEDTVLHLPHVKALTLVNCWMTPLSLRAFMRGFLDTPIRKLSFDSISLTGVPINSSGRVTDTRRRLLTIPPRGFVQNNPNSLLPHPHLPVHTDTDSDSDDGDNLEGDEGVSEWYAAPRAGSWSDIIDWISPGKRFQDFSRFNNTEHLPLNDLVEIEFKSCGYVMLQSPVGRGFHLLGRAQGALNFAIPHPGFQQHQFNFTPALQAHQILPPIVLEGLPFIQPQQNPANAPAANVGRRTAWIGPVPGFEGDHALPYNPFHYCFKAFHRAQAVIPSAMASQDVLLAHILQGIPTTELRAMLRVWNLKEGWNDKDAAFACLLDGTLESGGTGRFSGVIKKPV